MTGRRSTSVTGDGWIEVEPQPDEGAGKRRYAGPGASRADERRRIYLGEQLRCLVKVGKRAIPCEILDMAPRGIGILVLGAKEAPPPGGKLELMFRRSTAFEFTAVATVRTTEKLSLRGRDGVRLGLEFTDDFVETKEDYLEKVASKVVECRTYARPQAACDDFFLFRERLIFQVNGFSPKGIDLVVSARVKTLLPGMPLVLAVYIPGMREFQVRAQLGTMQYVRGKRRYRVFAKYDNVEPAFHDAIAQYLAMFAENGTPMRLRADGFTVGPLAMATSIVAAESPRDRADARAIDPRPDDFSRYARTLLCRVGPHAVATARLVFPEGFERRSYYRAHAPDLPEWVHERSTVELTPLRTSDVASIADYFVPFLQHVIRMAYQAGAAHLIVSADKALAPVYERIGFRLIGWNVYTLDLHKVLVANDHEIPEAVWSRVYEELRGFLKIPTRKGRTTRAPSARGQRS